MNSGSNECPYGPNWWRTESDIEGSPLMRATGGDSDGAPRRCMTRAEVEERVAYLDEQAQAAKVVQRDAHVVVCQAEADGDVNLLERAVARMRAAAARWSVCSTEAAGLAVLLDWSDADCDEQ